MASIFKGEDKDGLGIINTIAFIYILNENLGVQEEKVVTLIKILDPGNRKLVNYSDFIRLVHDPTSLDAMPLFKLGETAREEMQEKQRLIQ